jgi:nicotinamidase-related amidase
VRVVGSLEHHLHAFGVECPHHDEDVRFGGGAFHEKLGGQRTRELDAVGGNADYGGTAAVADAAGRGVLVATTDRLYPLDQAVQAATDYARRSKVGQIVVVM